jgi:hypothetical protein
MSKNFTERKVSDLGKSRKSHRQSPGVLQKVFKIIGGEKLKKRIFRLIFHCAGLCCLGGVVFLSLLVFFDIFTQGYFHAVETNFWVRLSELFLAFFASIYYFFLYLKFLKQA